jgi:hypothetical protein
LAKRVKAAALILAGLGVIALSVVALSRSGDDGGTTPERGDTTTPEAVIGALEHTGYQLRYRKVPKLEEYEIVSGEARHGGYGIQFAVEIKLSGPFEQPGKHYIPDPQPPVLRYGAGKGGTRFGNIWYATAHNSPERWSEGLHLKSERVEIKMSIKLGVELRELFAPRYRPVA